MGSTTIEQNSSLRAENVVLNSEKLLIDLADSDDTGSDSDICEDERLRITRAMDVEPGYEADVEQGNRSSDGSTKDGRACAQREVKDVLVTRRHADVNQGHIRSPEMCSQLVHLLEFKDEMTA